MSNIFILVHGTFAPRASWTRKSSPLRAELGRVIDQQRAKFLPFCWGGGNAQAVRQRGADRLRALLRETAAKYPNARIFVIGHSHGGNVILQALYGLRCRKRIAGLVLFGTPLLLASCRRHRLMIRSTALAVTALLLLLPIYGVNLLLAFMERSSVFVRVMAVVMLTVNLLWPLSRWSYVTTSQYLLTWFRRRRNEAQKKYRRPRTRRLPPTLQVVATADEAGVLLTAWRHLSELPHRLWPVIGMACFVWAIGAFGYVTYNFIQRVGLPIFRLQTLVFLPWLLLAITAAAFVVTLLQMIFVYMAALLFAYVARATPIAYGLEGFFDSAVLNIELSRRTHASDLIELPLGKVRRELGLLRFLRSLRHSLVYEHGETAARVAEWVRSRAA